MIDRININSVNSYRDNNKKQPQFKGGPLDAAVWALQACEAVPMLNVAVLDLSTAIIPRTVVESQTNGYAGFEAFRRESSGLIINCMIPGLIVGAIAKAIAEPTMGGKTKMGDCWANEDTINLVTDYWKQASKLSGATNEEKVATTIRNILKDTKGVDDKNIIDFSKGFDFEESVKTITKSVFEDVSKNDMTKAYKSVVNQTHVAENIKIKGQAGKEFFSQGLGSVMENTPKILKELVAGKDPADFAKKASKLVKSKSILGLGVIIPLALSAQPINRWITEKTSGKKGAPIYKDFVQSKSKELSPKEKFALNRQKLISASTMIGVAALSIMKKPSAMLKSLTQFKGIFPSMDQARLISTVTFVSRMMASEDKNDLREATVRDIATFSAFYFLGDYVSKGIASLIQKVKPEVKLINVLADSPDKNASIGKKIWHWTKNTALKSSDELVGTKAKQMRAICQLGNIGFSLVALGILIPLLNRNKTNKKREEELKKINVDEKINNSAPAFAMNMAKMDKKNVYSAFNAR